MVDSSVDWATGKSKPRNKAGTVFYSQTVKSLIWHTKIRGKQYILWITGSLWRFFRPQLLRAEFGIYRRNLQWWWYSEQLGREWSQGEESVQIAGPGKRGSERRGESQGRYISEVKQPPHTDLQRWNLFQKENDKALIKLASQVTISHSRNCAI